jgi:signal transduction histidine kinase/RNAse (barnase) inhibitor barstar
LDNLNFCHNLPGIILGSHYPKNAFMKNTQTQLQTDFSPKFSLARIIFVWALCLLGVAMATPADSSETSRWAATFLKPGNAAVSLPEFNDGYGVVFRDINGDRYPDLYVVRFRDLNRFFINERGKFVDFTIPSGLGGNLVSIGQSHLELGASAVDFDNDGRQDILIIGWDNTTALFRQSGDLIFEPYKTFATDTHPIDGNAGIWADIDKDGDLDLFVTDEHHPNHLLINDGYGNFREAADSWGVADGGVSQGAAFGDINNDGFPDLYVCNWFAEDRLYRNVNGKYFEAVALDLPHLTEAINSNGITFGDVNNDGDLDILVTDRHGKSAIYLNVTRPDSAPAFTLANDFLGFHNPYPAYGSVIADFNNDGWQDIFVTNIGPNRLFINQNGKYQTVFEDTAFSDVSDKYYSTGVAAADFDLDGDLDLFVANKDTAGFFYRNPLTEGFFLRFVVEGVSTNRDAVGTKITLFSQPDSGSASLQPAGFREINGGGGYLSAGEHTVHFGLSRQGRYVAQIQFPDGTIKSLSINDVNRTITVSEVTGLRKTILRTLQFLNGLIHQQKFWLNTGLFLIWGLLLTGFIVLFHKRYRWQGYQTTIFLGVITLSGYLLFLIFSNYATHAILLGQLAITLLTGLVLLIFQEKIYHLERQRQAHRKLLENFSQEIIFIKDNDTLFQNLTATIRQALNVQWCSIWQWDDLENQFVLHHSQGEYSPLTDRFTLPPQLQNSISEKSPDTSHLKAVLNSHCGITAELVIPVYRSGKWLALMALSRRNDGQPFVHEDITVLQILARQTAIAIENNRYIEETRRLTQKVTESEIRERYIHELESKNRELEKLYRELQETQTQLIHSEKMAGLGQLVAGVAHELNNPISFVYANLRMLEDYMQALRKLIALATDPPGDSVLLAQKIREISQAYDWAFLQQDIGNIISESLEGSRRVKEVVENLRTFSRLDEAEWKQVDLHDGLDSTLKILHSQLKDRITVLKNYGELPKVSCNPGQINQVFMNLLVNAAQAIPDKGEIRITTRHIDEYVEIEICDNGVGIPEEVLPRIFDPFYTTKPVGKGTGLGLSVSYGIIRKHHGEISVRSRKNEGTCFTIRLPISAPSQDARVS